MTKIEELLRASDQRTAFDALASLDSDWLKVHIAPSTSAGYWHVAVIERGGSVMLTKRPVSPDFVDYTLRHCGVLDAEYSTTSKEPSSRNPWDSEPAKPVSDVRDVYFIQGVDGGPIKIGVAESPDQRMAAIQLMSPVPLRILGVMRGAGQPEERRLHEMFAEHRSHGEWFRPSQELIDYIGKNT